MQYELPQRKPTRFFLDSTERAEGAPDTPTIWVIPTMPHAGGNITILTEHRGV